MKIKALLLTLLVMFATIAATAQVESGKVYRIVNKLYGSYVYESVVDNTVKCSSKSTSTDYNQLWTITETSVEGNYTIKNLYTGRYLCFEQNKNVTFRTLIEPTYLYINDNSSEFNGCYSFTAIKDGTWGMHCDGSSKCVPWYTNAEGTNWTFQEVEISDEEIAEAQDMYKEFFNTLSNVSQISTIFENFFEDKACTILKSEYAAMSDDELNTEMSAIPADLQAVILKIKNNTWNTEKREKEFRIYDYKPYSDVNKWADVLFIRLYSPIDNPTGICTANDKSFTYVCVDEIPDNTYIELAEMPGTGYFGTNTRLHEGLNIVPAAQTDGFLYIKYICETDTLGSKLADYPAVKVHIENGYVNGFWSKERGHTNEDWKYMQQYMFENEEAIQVKGTFSLLDFRKKEFLAACPEKITEVINLWDYYNKTQQKYMMLDKYYPWFNNLQLAMSNDEGFMDAGNHRTHYNNNTLSAIVNYETLCTDAGQAWGPLHEIGHNNQYAIQIVGTSEVSNNALANIVNFERGTHTSRGNNLENQILDFENKVPYIVRGEGDYGSKLFSMTRMYFQLFLYAHAAGKCPDFYPRLYERLRYDRLVGWTTRSQCAGTGDCADDPKDANGYVLGSMNAKNDQLKFAEVCCEILQMDLSEFFEAWGFFIPFKNAFVGDYGHHHAYLLQEDIDASKARMQKYEKKGGHLMFLEDRVRPSKYIDNKELNILPALQGYEYIKDGYRANYASWDGERIGEVGDFGQWEDYIDETVKAKNYYYTNINGKITIVEAEGASGALGFKLYNADTNELLTFTNRKSMTIPMSARSANLKVVAAQADGTDYIVPTASEGPIDMQKAALKNSITQAKRITNNIGDNVGQYQASYTQTLQNLVNEAVADSAALKVHSAVEWSTIIDDEYNSVLSNKKARIIMKEGATYYMYNANKKSYYLTWSASGVSGAQNQDSEEAHWMLEYAGEPDTYYIKCANGMYIASVTSDGIAGNAYTAANAAKFKISYTDNSRTFFTLTTNDNTAIALKSNAGGTADSPTKTLAQWYVRMLEDNIAEFESTTLSSLMDKSKKIFIEVTDTLEIERKDTVLINKNAEMIDITLQDNLKTLYNTYKNVKSNYDKTDEYHEFISALRIGLANVEGKYLLKSPKATSDGYFYWYVIRSEITNKIWSIPSTDKNKRPTLSDTKTEDATDDMLWAVVPSLDSKGEYNLINASTETALRRYYLMTMAQNSYTLATTGKGTPLPITFTYNSDTNYTTIHTGTAAAVDNGQTTLLQYSTITTSGWKFELVAIEKNDELYETLTSINEIVVESEDANVEDESTYDLFGRKVLTPMKNNIYIKNGEKVIIK